MVRQDIVPYTVRIFLPFGDPSGMRIFDSFINTAIGIVFKRTGFEEATRREELKQPGVYILVGENDGELQGEESRENSLLPTIYIGEGDPIIDRLKSHNAEKDFWTWAIAFTSKGDMLNKAHIQYIEYRLISLASEAKRCNLDNKNQPQCPSMSEADKADCNNFLGAVLSMLPLTGLSIFTTSEGFVSEVKNATNTDAYPSLSTPLHESILEMTGNEMNAKGRQTSSGFIVLKDSEAVLETSPKAQSSIVATRNDLIEKGILEKRDSRFVFTEDYLFTSPSNAACVIMGTSVNGRVYWHNSEGNSRKLN